ncbi:galactosylceramide sulfotransferase-like [Anneissia japonica]|uniref:galactosylceramide sulfotransferase-like n=1 Tax=Anneissia japonica TaxID=1529436 RepID=UPI0014255DE4|nr:galactosylceramide sulfotransferase-like [Anneissia japonica]XP_033102864.1 galactosylceramide sulfotransferase-like [Anneissia japonica]
MSRLSKRNVLILVIFIFFIIFGTVYNYEDNFNNLTENSRNDFGAMQLWHALQDTVVIDKPVLKNALLENKSNITTILKKSPEVVNKDVAMRLSSAKLNPAKTLDTIKQLPLEGQQCQPRTNIAFFKMHKCSSSTVQNILFRYGDVKDLNFVLPVIGNYLGRDLFNKRNMRKFRTEDYNILCHHTRFSYRGMQEVLPADAVFVTIIRDPATMFESMFTYSKYDALYHLSHYADPLEKFLNNPDLYYSSNRAKSHAKNPMLYDLGLSIDQKDNMQKIDAMITELSDQFNLVMITEYFDESLILLKELMCWSLDDVVYVVLNARAKESVRKISPENADKIRQWNAGDVKLYEHFNKTFWRKVESFGKEKMAKEVAELRERKRYFVERCVGSVVENDKKVWHPGGIKVESFRLKPEAFKDMACVRLIRTELPYTDYLMRKQVLRFRHMP